MKGQKGRGGRVEHDEALSWINFESLALSNTNEMHTYLDRGSERGKECINVESEWCGNLYAALQNSLGLMK